MKDIALHILDIALNSVSAGATRVSIEIVENRNEDKLTLRIADNGKGMNDEMIQKVTDPYFTTRTTRRVGMGIPLLKHSAEQAGGSFGISSVLGQGTSLIATFVHSHMDRPPTGDIAGVISMLAGANPSMDFVYHHVRDDSRYNFDTREIKEALEDIPLNEPAVIRYMKEMIEENTKEIKKT